MSVFRRRRVFRTNRETPINGSLSIVTATATAALAFSGSALGSTTAITASATGSIVFTGTPISEMSIELSGTGTVVVSAAATGLQRNLGTGSRSIVFTGTARNDALAVGSITFTGSATVGTIFTMDGSGSLVLTGSATAVTPTTTASRSIVFTGAAGPGQITGGTIETSGSGQINFTGTANGGIGEALIGQIVVTGSAIGTRISRVRTPAFRTYVVKWDKCR